MKKNEKIVCFGEVLWDVLPSGKVIGGAPLNVAYHLQKHGLLASFISSVGKDENGDEIIKTLAQLGVDSQLVQTNPSYATSVVLATPAANNEMVYDIVQPVAWDDIRWNEAFVDLVKQATYFICGSLVARCSGSNETLFRLLALAPYVVVDINLRSPHFTTLTLSRLLKRADMLKLNSAELDLLCSNSEWSVDNKIQSLSAQYDIPTMVVTLGAEGAILYKDGLFTHQAGIPTQVVDTVGSGDAFLAALLYGFSVGFANEEALRYANKIGALVASKAGACPAYTPPKR